jgi:hypothetical protein
LYRDVIINSLSKELNNYTNPAIIISWILSELKNQYGILENEQREV